MHFSRPKWNEKNATRYYGDSVSTELLSEANPLRRTVREVPGRGSKEELEKSTTESGKEFFENPYLRMQSPPGFNRPTIGTTYIYNTGGSRSPIRQSGISSMRKDLDMPERKTLRATIIKRDDYGAREVNMGGDYIGAKSYTGKRSPKGAATQGNDILLDQPMGHFVRDDKRSTHDNYDMRYTIDKGMSPNKNYEFLDSYEERKKDKEQRMTKFINDPEINYIEYDDYEKLNQTHDISKSFNHKKKTTQC